MGRPLTGKTHVGIRRETRSNGDVYVYERVTGYDPKTQKTNKTFPKIGTIGSYAVCRVVAAGRR